MLVLLILILLLFVEMMVVVDGGDETTTLCILGSGKVGASTNKWLESFGEDGVVM